MNTTSNCLMLHKSSVRDEILRVFWEEQKRCRTTSLVFYGGEVRDYEDFVSLVRRPCNHWWALFWRGQPAGYVWVNDAREHSARIHYSFFRCLWGKGPEAPSIIMGRYMNSRLLRLKDEDGRFLFDVLYGFTPVRNEIAAKRMQETGAVVRGIIPHGCWFADKDQSEDAIFSTVTRESTEDIWQNA